MVKELAIGLLFSAGDAGAIYVDPSLDITAEVIKRFDTAMSSKPAAGAKPAAPATAKPAPPAAGVKPPASAIPPATPPPATQKPPAPAPAPAPAKP